MENLTYKDYLTRFLAQTEINPHEFRKLTNVEIELTTSNLKEASNHGSNLKKVAKLKLNGGLGTTMGSPAGKSSIIVREGKSFLDLYVEQIRFLNAKYSSAVPLLLMNSFYTAAITNKLIEKYKPNPEIICFEQSHFPRLLRSNYEALDEKKYGNNAFYPPGHGEVYQCLWQQGLLAKLIDRGIEYLFISNSDNLCASLDLNILNWLVETKTEILMEVTTKLVTDKKGSILCVDSKDKIQIIELTDGKSSVATPATAAPVFNTNNLWINLPALIKKMEEGNWNLPLISNNKTIDGNEIMQLECAIGSAISQFDHPRVMLVGRERFLPVKSCNDLFIAQSNLFQINEGRVIRSNNATKPLPQVELGPHFQMIKEYSKRLSQMPDITDLEQLTIEGDVVFAGSSKLSGKVKIVAKDKPIIIPDGAVYSDQEILS